MQYGTDDPLPQSMRAAFFILLAAVVTLVAADVDLPRFNLQMIKNYVGESEPPGDFLSEVRREAYSGSDETKMAGRSIVRYLMIQAIESVTNTTSPNYVCANIIDKELHCRAYLLRVSLMIIEASEILTRVGEFIKEALHPIAIFAWLWSVFNWISEKILF